MEQMFRPLPGRDLGLEGRARYFGLVDLAELERKSKENVRYQISNSSLLGCPDAATESTEQPYDVDVNSHLVCVVI